MSDIVLSAGVRSNLLQLQQTSNLIDQTQIRLSTGKRVNSALDNAINFFTAQGLDNRANDLSGLLDSMSNAINTIQAANNGITAITKLVQSAQALTSQAKQTTDSTTRDSLASQFDALLVQIGQLAGDAGFNGVNLLGGDDLTVNFNEDATSSTSITGVDYTNANATPLGIANAVNWSAANGVGDTNIDTAVCRSDRSAYHVAFGIADTRRKPVDRADPSGLHEGDDQHAADRFFGPHTGGLERRRRELARLADSPAALDDSSVVGGAGRPERAAIVPINRTNFDENGGLRAAVFFALLRLWLANY